MQHCIAARSQKCAHSCTGLIPGVLVPGVAGDKIGQFNGVLDCFVKTARQEGIGAFYKGFAPNFGRLGSWNVAMFLTLEQVSVAGGVGSQGRV